VADSLALENPAAIVLSVPEIRDYRAVNQELVRCLDQGCPALRLTGAQGQRLLAAGLRGRWSAVLELEGDAGPELAAGLEAPGLTIVCRGSAGDGAASGLKAGSVLVLGQAGPAFGYAQGGGLALVVSAAGARAGLGQLGGDLVLLGGAGPMAGERQAGGRLCARGELGPHAGRGRSGGRFLSVDTPRTTLDVTDLAALEAALAAVKPWLNTEPLGS
jgi:glutamate synthase domain-containing protein 3